jgi:hypothetical protein
VVVNPLLEGLLLPSKLMLRTLDDLHTLAVTAERAVDLLDRLDARATSIERQLETGIALGRDLERRGADIAALGGQFEHLGDALLTEARSTQAIGAEIATRGAEIAAALPLLQRALDLGEPLEGAIERAGRIVDRLPGGRHRGGSGTPPPRGS